MNAKEISDETLESITPADDDLLVVYDTSTGTTGKATIADIAPKVAENIDIADLPTVTPAVDDALMVRDTSADTTGKATIADIVQKGALVSGLQLLEPLIKKQDSDIEGGEIRLEPADNADITRVSIDIYGNILRFFTTYKNDLRIFTINFETKETYWN